MFSKNIDIYQTPSKQKNYFIFYIDYNTKAKLYFWLYFDIFYFDMAIVVVLSSFLPPIVFNTE